MKPAWPGMVPSGLERWLEAERDQLALWLPVALGSGVAAWFLLPGERQWTIALLALAGTALAALALGRGGRAGRVVALAAIAAAIGLGLIWWRAERAAAPVLARPVIAMLTARIERVEPLAARQLVRLRLAPIALAGAKGPVAPMPAHVRLNLAAEDVPAGLSRGAIIMLQARLMPPPQPAVPGAYDYGRVAWFDGIGGTGRGFAPVRVRVPGAAATGGLRERLSQHIRAQAEGAAGGIASALATGDQGGIPEDDAEAMRRSGLAHLLSVSGLHITAVVGGVMFLVARLLALSPWLALRWRLPLVSAGAGAAAAIGYTLLTGAEVPTIRSCVAALLVLVALALGREALTLRLVAAGALIVLLLFPESIAGPSFQLSFAAVASIVALHEHPRVKAWFAPREEPRRRRLARDLASLLLTGIVVELALLPIGLFHFHKAGVYGALANIVAIPLTTFVIMPLEALALLFDVAGWGAPFWWLATQALRLLLGIAHLVTALPGSVAALPAMPGGAYAAMLGGGLWLGLWRTRWRRIGLVPLSIGAGWALLTPAPDLLVTGDGRHVALRTRDGGLALLRDRVGDYTANMLAENGGADGAPLFLADQPEARCSPDLCLAERTAGGRRWRIVATRSAYLVPAAALVAACRTADIVISERRLPRGCTPRWLKLDQPVLARTGGLAVTLGTQGVVTVNQPGDRHPWRLATLTQHQRARYQKARSDRTRAFAKPPRPARPQS